MPLTEQAFTTLVDAGCTACASKKLVVEAIVAQKMPILGGEPYGTPSWGYKGEELVQGTFRVSCDHCKKELHTEAACSRCGSADGVAKALASENAFPLPAACTGCGSELLTATVLVPAEVIYEGKRAAKARTQTVPEDPGFHAARVECKECRNIMERRTTCVLCA